MFSPCEVVMSAFINVGMSLSSENMTSSSTYDFKSSPETLLSLIDESFRVCH